LTLEALPSTARDIQLIVPRTVAITPSKANALPVETVRKVCQEWTVAGLTTILDANPTPPKPFRFLYMSGIAAYDPERRHSKDVEVWTPKSMVEYSKMRVRIPSYEFHAILSSRN
jgi:hypothetical protein